MKNFISYFPAIYGRFLFLILEIFLFYFISFYISYMAFLFQGHYCGVCSPNTPPILFYLFPTIPFYFKGIIAVYVLPTFLRFLFWFFFFQSPTKQERYSHFPELAQAICSSLYSGKYSLSVSPGRRMMKERIEYAV